MFLSIVMPLYNEENNISSVIDDHVSVISRWPEKILSGWEFICLDDASTDKTWQILQDYSLRIPQLKLLQNKTNQGITPSFLRLFTKANGDYIYVTAGDGQWPAENLDRLLKTWQKENADIIIGVRTQRKKVYNWWRNVLSYGFNFCAYLLFGIQAQDANGIKLGRKEIFDIPLSSKSFFSEIERLIIAKKKQFKFAYCDVSFLPRIHGIEKGSNLRNLFLTIKDMIGFKLQSIYKTQDVK